MWWYVVSWGFVSWVTFVASVLWRWPCSCLDGLWWPLSPQRCPWCCWAFSVVPGGAEVFWCLASVVVL